MSAIIIDGPDGCGKTTLLQELQTGPCQGWGSVHNGTYAGVKARDLFQLYTRQLLSAEEKPLLFDRSFDSEGVYGPVMRGLDRLGKHGRKLLNRLASALGTTQVLCLPPVDVALHNWKLKVNDYVDKEERWFRVYKGFEAIARDTHRYVKYDYTWNEGRTRKDLCQRFSSLFNMTAGRDRLPKGMVGSSSAGYLIVGEQVNPKKVWVDLPFFDVQGVSVYLAEVLESLGAAEYNLAFINAFDQEGRPNDLVGAMDRLPQCKRMICLGRKAFAAAKGLNPIYVGHPNYVLRFNKKRQFKKALREALGL